MKYIVTIVAAMFCMGWTPYQNISNNTGESVYPVIEADSTNNIHVIWRDATPGKRSVLYTRFDGFSWLPCENVSVLIPDAENVACNPEFCIADDDTLRLVWVEKCDLFSVIHAVRDVSWIFEKLIVSPSNYFGEFGICVDSMNYSHILYTAGGTDKGINYVYFDGSYWNFDMFVMGLLNASAYPQLAHESSGKLHAVWVNNTRGNYNVYHAYKTPVTSWTGVNVIEDTLGKSYVPRTDIDRDNDIHLVYQDDVDGSNNIYYSVYNHVTSTWDIPAKIHDSHSESISPDIAVDSHGIPHVVFADNQSSQYQIYYFKKDGTAWTTPINISNCPGDANHPRIDKDWDDVCHVVWDNNSGSPEEVYYTNNKDTLLPLHHCVTGFFMMYISFAIYRRTRNPFWRSHHE